MKTVFPAWKAVTGPTSLDHMGFFFVPHGDLPREKYRLMKEKDDRVRTSMYILLPLNYLYVLDLISLALNPLNAVSVANNWEAFKAPQKMRVIFCRPAPSLVRS